MEFLNVLAAAVAAFGFGAVWYIALSKPWLAASGVTEAQQRAGGPIPFVFAMRRPALTLIDGVNSVVGCTIIGAVLNAF